MRNLIFSFIQQSIKVSVRIFKAALEGHRIRNAQKQTIRALNGLNNRELKDLAISRSEIYAVSFATSMGSRRARTR